MGYCISRQEPLAQAIRRIIREQLDKALAGLSDRRDPVEGVHTARKCLKKIRAVLRLIRSALPDPFFRKQNIFFRDAGRFLSPLRDTHVQREALQQMNFSANTVALTFADKLAHDEDSLSHDRATTRKTASMLSKARDELERWPLQKLGGRDVADGFRRIYKQTRRAYETSLRKPSAENLHEWRKRTKDLWYAHELVGEFRSATMNNECRRTKKLSDFLGDDHDLFFIGENLREQALARPRTALRKVERKLRKKRATLESCAFRIGRKIFSDKPAVVEKRLRRRLRT